MVLISHIIYGYGNQINVTKLSKGTKENVKIPKFVELPVVIEVDILTKPPTHSQLFENKTFN